ncbi:MAG: cbb3-type cytochrome c oxidase subunit II [Gemmataceae bacterium]
MDRGMVIFVGALLTFTSSWLGLVLFPYWQLNAEQPYRKDAADDPYPLPLQGEAIAGRKIYMANGCIYCHTQQVRSEKFGNWWDENGQERTGSDIKRGWGLRRTVSRDYIYDRPTLLGTMRTGPDLANVGSRYSEAWQHTHTFNPRTLNDWSIMPSFAFLYRKEKVVGERSEKSLKLGREWTVDPGYRWRPSSREWDAILQTRGDAIKRQFLAEPTRGGLDLAKPEDEAAARFLAHDRRRGHADRSDRRRRCTRRVSARASQGRGSASGGQGMSTPNDPKPPLPEGAGTESVIDMHRQLMTEFNDPTMTADGSLPEETEGRDTIQRMLDVLARENAEPTASSRCRSGWRASSGGSSRGAATMWA